MSEAVRTVLKKTKDIQSAVFLAWKPLKLLNPHAGDKRFSTLLNVGQDMNFMVSFELLRNAILRLKSLHLDLKLQLNSNPIRKLYC